MMKPILAAAALVLACGAQGAQAGEVDNAVATVVSHMPHDSDGRISRQTFLAYMEATFDRLDADKSGAINPANIKVVKVCVPMHGWRYVPGASLTGC